MPIRIYRAPQIGNGTIFDPFRSLLNDFIDYAGNAIKVRQMEEIRNQYKHVWVEKEEFTNTNTLTGESWIEERDVMKFSYDPISAEDQALYDSIRESIEWFDEIDNPATQHSICTVHAGQSVHDEIYNDRLINPGRIIYLSELAVDETDKRSKLSGLYADKQKAFKDEISKVFKEDRADDSKIKAGVVLKDVLRIYLENSLAEQRKIGGGAPLDWSEAKFKFAGEDF